MRCPHADLHSRGVQREGDDRQQRQLHQGFPPDGKLKDSPPARRARVCCAARIACELRQMCTGPQALPMSCLFKEHQQPSAQCTSHGPLQTETQAAAAFVPSIPAHLTAHQPPPATPVSVQRLQQPLPLLRCRSLPPPAGRGWHPAGRTGFLQRQRWRPPQRCWGAGPLPA